MRLIIFSCALFAVSAAICNSSQISEYEVFAQKYETTFGEKPSDQVWNLDRGTGDGDGIHMRCGIICDPTNAE
jgi:hypothetical protein